MNAILGSFMGWFYDQGRADYIFATLIIYTNGFMFSLIFLSMFESALCKTDYYEKIESMRTAERNGTSDNKEETH